MVAITRGLFGHATPGPWYGAYREDWHTRSDGLTAPGIGGSTTRSRRCLPSTHFPAIQPGLAHVYKVTDTIV